MPNIRFYRREPVPVEMHRVRIVQQLTLLPAEQRLLRMRSAGYNTFQLHSGDIFLDLLTDSGVNAMSDEMQSAMLRADDAYAGSETFYRMRDRLEEITGIPHFLPIHQGRACEHILAAGLVRPGRCVLMNYHFTTAKAHITRLGGYVEELLRPEGLRPEAGPGFKGDLDLGALERTIGSKGAENIAYLRIEAGTNLIGGQPISYANMKSATEIVRRHGIPSVLDASLLQDNLYFIKTRESGMERYTVSEILRKVADLFDIVYFSGRKFGFGRGGGILVRDEATFRSLQELVPMFEGFLTYGGMSVKEMEALTVGFGETLNLDIISQAPLFIEYCVRKLDEYGVPMVLPAGGLGAHIDAKRFVPQIPQPEYPAGALACALYLCGGIRAMERGTLSEQRNPDGSENLSPMELVRLALPRRVFTLSQIEYVIDRIEWLYDHRELIGGLRFAHEPKTLRFFTGSLEPTSDWPETLVAAFRSDFGPDQ